MSWTDARRRYTETALDPDRARAVHTVPERQQRRYAMLAHLIAEAWNGDHPSILDGGCGLGDFAPVLAQIRPGSRYLGVDISLPMIQRARASHPGRRFLCADLVRLPLIDNSVHLGVICCGFSFAGPEDSQRLWDAVVGLFRVCAIGIIVLDNVGADLHECANQIAPIWSMGRVETGDYLTMMWKVVKR